VPVIETLREEHRNISRMLDALEHQIEVLAQVGTPDYEIIRGIADYFCDYPDRCHHPKENAVFERLRVRFPEDTVAVGDLESEHRDTGARARRFREFIYAIDREAVMSRDAVVDAGRSFVEAERRHMRMEEEQFFRLAEEKLAPEDWLRIDDVLTKGRDPIFGDGVEGKFRDLRERLLAWEEEYKRG
jgi:hemerythrin-like domain-containing protein